MHTNLNLAQNTQHKRLLYWLSIVQLILALGFLRPATLSAASLQLPAAENGCTQFHKVGSSDSLESIAARYNTDSSHLMLWNNLNHLANPSLINNGVTLCVASPLDEAVGTLVTIQNGDSLWKYAREFSSTIAQITAANGIKNANTIRSGQIIHIPFSLYREPTNLPENLKTPRDQRTTWAVFARGVQIYICQTKADDANAFEWKFKLPEATLYNKAGGVVGKHYAGPTWESTDGTKVVGTLKERAQAPQATAIPWLLLTVSDAPQTGIFKGVTYVQRINTTGGAAPTTGCSAQAIGTEIGVPYTADYFYYAPKPQS